VTSTGRVLAIVDLGGGRATVTSPPGVSSVADRRWHSVVVGLDRSDVQLVLDDVFESRATLPGDHVELNVDFGLILGVPLTQAHASASQETTSFRGCLRSVVYNSVDVLTAALRSRSDTAQVTAVTWNRLEWHSHENISYNIIAVSSPAVAITYITPAANSEIVHSAFGRLFTNNKHCRTIGFRIRSIHKTLSVIGIDDVTPTPRSSHTICGGYSRL